MLEKFLRPNVKKDGSNFNFQNIFLGKKKRILDWLSRNIERKYFREIQLHKKESCVKSMCENEKNPN